MFAVTMSVPTVTFDRWKAACGEAAMTASDGPLAAVGDRLVLDLMPAYIQSRGEGKWTTPLRGGNPMMATGKWGDGFSYSLGLDRKSVRLTNSSMPADVIAHLNNGGPINAKDKYAGVPGGPYLAVPLPTLSKTEALLGPSGFKGVKTFVAKSRNDNWILFEKVMSAKTGKQTRSKSKFASRWARGQAKQESEDKIRPLFVLKKSVTTPPFTWTNWTETLKAGAIDAAMTAIRKQFKGGA